MRGLGKKMKFIVDIKRVHFYSYNKYTANKLKQEIHKSKTIVVLSNLFWILLGIYFFSVFREYQHICKSNFKYVAVSFVVLWCLLTTYYVYSKIFYKLFIQYSVKDNGLTLGELEIELTESGIHTKKPHFTSFHSWEVIQNLDSNEICFFLVIENNRAIILPKDQINKNILHFIKAKI